MSKEKKEKRKLKAPWDNVQTAIWMLGLAVLFLNNWWWPGILVLIAVSVLSETAIEFLVPDAFIVEKPHQEVPAAEKQQIDNGSLASPEASQTHPSHRLPPECSHCGAPVRAGEVRWREASAADCSYCGANLVLRPD